MYAPPLAPDWRARLAPHLPRLVPAGPRAAGTVLVLAAAACFASVGVLAKTALDAGASPVGMLAVRFPVAAAVLLAIAMVRREPLPRGRDLRSLLALGVFGFGVQAMLFFTALSLAPAGLVVVCVFTYPAFVTALEAVRTRTPVPARRVRAIAIALAGVVLAAGSVTGGSTLGAGLALLAGLYYSVQLVLGQSVLRRVPPVTAAATALSGAAAAFAVGALLTGATFPQAPAGWAGLVALGVVATALPLLCLYAGIRRLGTADAAVVSTAEPPLALLFATAFLGEPFGLRQLLGAGLIVGGVVLLAREHPEAVLPRNPAGFGVRRWVRLAGPRVRLPYRLAGPMDPLQAQARVLALSPAAHHVPGTGPRVSTRQKR